MTEDQSNPFGLIWDEEQVYLRSLLVGVTWGHIWRDCNHEANHLRHNEIFNFRVGTFMRLPAAAIISRKRYLVLVKITHNRTVDGNSYVGLNRDPNLSGNWWVMPPLYFGKVFYEPIKSEWLVLGKQYDTETARKFSGHFKRVGGP